MLPKKIASRIEVHHKIEDLENLVRKAEEGKDPMNIVEWVQQRNAVYEESARKVTL